MSSWNYRHTAQFPANFVVVVVIFLVKTGFHHVDQAGLELLNSGDPLPLASESAGIAGISHCAQPQTNDFKHAHAWDWYIIYSLLYFLILCRENFKAFDKRGKC